MSLDPMTLEEACELVQTWGRHHQAAWTIAQAVAKKGVLANEMREIEARAVAAREAAQKAEADVAAAMSQAAWTKTEASAAVERMTASAKAETEKLVRDASAEASGIVTRAKAEAARIVDAAKKAAADEDAKRNAAHLARVNAEEALAALNADSEAAQAKLDGIRAAIRAAAEV